MRILATELSKHGFTVAETQRCRKLALVGHQTGFINNRFDKRAVIDVKDALDALSELAHDSRRHVLDGRKKLRKKLEALTEVQV